MTKTIIDFDQFRETMRRFYWQQFVPDCICLRDDYERKFVMSADCEYHTKCDPWLCETGANINICTYHNNEQNLFADDMFGVKHVQEKLPLYESPADKSALQTTLV